MNDEMKFTNHNNEDQEILQLLEMLSQLPEAPVPDEFDLRMRRALKEENAKRREEAAVKKTAVKNSIWKKWTAMAACLMIGFLSFQMIQGGVSSDMMESAVKNETADIGESAGPTVAMEAEIQKIADEPADELPLLQEEPVLISDIMDGTWTLEKSAETNYGAGMGIDGEMLQISRGQAASKSREAFMADCDQALVLLTEGIAEGDSRKLAEAMNYKNTLEYTEEEADHVLKLYNDLFTEEETSLDWKNISVTAWSRSHVYRLTDGIRGLMVVITDTPDGLKVVEPIMEHSEWLYEQIGGQDFTLVDVIYTPETEEIEFLVELNKRKKKETRSFVWKETESL